MRAGLRRVLADTPVRHGWVEASATWAPALGLAGRLEAGVRPWERVSIFGFGELSSGLGPSAGVGARVEF